MDISKLNTNQSLAVIYDGNALLILAGAGTGKTETLTSRIAYMIQERQIPPSNILAMTFTNKAAKEMKERAARLSGIPPMFLNIGTFHSMCSYMLRVYSEHTGISKDFEIIDATQSSNIMKKLYTETYRKQDIYNKYTSKIEEWKNEGLSCEKVSAIDDRDLDILKFYKEYTKLCRKNNFVDFGDLLIIVSNALDR